MDSQEFDKNKALSSFNFIPAPFLMKLEEYNIQTIGQLLSATKGLTNTDLLFTSPEEKEVLEKLKESIPEEIRKEYEAFSFTHPTGLITNKNKQDEEKDSNTTE
ncbi:MAG TPA: hypothetical protein VKA38_08510 [Draconibacterium sp.]|nr:hypothetical protein [Draconibacterium sp.]